MAVLRQPAFHSMEKRQAEEILEGALQLLERVGLSVPSTQADLPGRLQKAGLPLSNGRMRVPRPQVLEYLEGLRARGSAEPPAPDAPLTGMVSIYSSHVEDLEGEIRLFDTQALIHWAAYCRRCGEAYGFVPNVPGYAADVPAALESLHKYRISAVYCGHGPLEPSSGLSAQYMLEMAEVLGEKERRFPAFPGSPLSFSGSSLESVVENAAKLDSAYVYAMSMLGVTTPFSVVEGFAVNVAEVLGCAVALHHLTGLPVDIRPNLIPFDHRCYAPAFGTPDKFWLEWMAAQLYAHLLGEPLRYASTNIHTYAQRSGPQAAAEKGWMMAAGAALGARKFYCIGTLAMDEVFSPVQLVWDAEMMRQLDKLRSGMPLSPLEEDFVHKVAEDLAEGYMATEQTLENYQMISAAGIFSRQGLSGWRSKEEKDALERARETAAGWAAGEAEPVAAPHVAAELEKIYLCAAREIS